MRRWSIAFFVGLLVAAIVMPSVAMAGPTAAPHFSTATSTPNLPIPDANPTGVSNNLNFGPSEVIADVDIELHINHSWVGDLIITVTHGATSVIIIDRPGRTTSGAGCAGDNINAVISDEGGPPAETSCTTATGLNFGPYSPNNPLSAFDGANAQGTWTITVSDNAALDTGTLVSWSVIVTPVVTNVALTYGASCNGNNLDIHIIAGDGPFNITGTSGNGLPVLGVGTGITTLIGPDFWGQVVIAETTGDLESGIPLIVACSTATPALVVNVTDSTSGEDGSTATVEVSLSAPLLTSVGVPYSSSDTTEGTATGSFLTILRENWDVPHTITVTGVNDDVDDGDIAYTLNLGPTTSGNSSFAGLTGTANLTNIDDDTAGYVFAAVSPFEVDEDGTLFSGFYIGLASQPTANVTVNITNPDGQCVLFDTTLTFTTSDWATLQYVGVGGFDDAVAEGTHGCDVEMLSASADPAYQDLPATIGFTVFDNDTAALILDPTTLFTWEENEDYFIYYVSLATQPAPGETVTVTIDAPVDQMTLSKTTLTFDDTDWNIPQEVKVNPVEDDITEGEMWFDITHTTSTTAGAGAPYDGAVALLPVVMFDDPVTAFPPPFHTPNIGEILISAGAPVMSYGAAGDYPTGIVLPADYDGNGFDTYIVTETKTVAGELWFAVFIGNETWVWVPADSVTVLR